MRKLYLPVIMLLIIAASTAIYLARRSVQTGPSEPGPLQKVTLGLPMQPTDALPILTYHNGYFKEEGLDVTLIEYPSGKRALLEGLLGNQVDVIVASEVPVVLGFLERHPLQILASVGTADNINRLVARKDRGIHTPADLAGKKIATQRASAVHYFLHLFLQNYAIDSNSVRLVYMDAEELPDALASGKIDAFSMREPYISRARELLGENIVVFQMPGLFLQAELLVSDSAYSRKHPDIVLKLIKSLIRAEKYAKDNPQDAIATIASALRVESDAYRPLWYALDPRVRLDQSLLTLLESQARWAIANNMTTNKTVPNFLDSISVETLRSVKPDAVTIIR